MIIKLARRLHRQRHDAGAVERPHDVRLQGWLAACSQGDQQAFENLYRFTAPKLYAFAVRLMRDESLAEECLQDVYVRIWHHAHEYAPERAAPLTWMIGILRHRALDLLRRRGRETTLAEPDDLEQLVNAHAGAVDDSVDEDSRALYACLGQLREEQRRCLQLAYFDHLSHAEMAERLHVPLGTVKTWVRRALEQLRQCLG